LSDGNAGYVLCDNLFMTKYCLYMFARGEASCKTGYYWIELQ
jgi:hypothetical protein